MAISAKRWRSKVFGDRCLRRRIRRRVWGWGSEAGRIQKPESASQKSGGRRRAAGGRWIYVNGIADRDPVVEFVVDRDCRFAARWAERDDQGGCTADEQSPGGWRRTRSRAGDCRDYARYRGLPGRR